MEPQIAFCRAPDGVRIAYATYGSDDAPPLLFELSWMGQESIWNYPEGRSFLEALGAGRRLVTYDPRGVGASEREIGELTAAHFADDMASVVDHLELERFDVFSMFGRAAIPYAAAHVERVDRIVLWAPFASTLGYPASTHEMMRTSWHMFTRAAATIIYPSGPKEAQRWCSDALRTSVAPEHLVKETSLEMDLMPFMARIQHPALVLHRRGDQNTPVGSSRKVATLLSRARFVPLDGDAHHPLFNHSDYMSGVREFLGVAPRTQGTAPQGTAIILFLDIADSTALTTKLGDAAYRERERELDTALRAAITEASGTPVEGKVLGDGVMAVFTSARQAIDAAQRCRDLGNEASLPLHIGIHAGDVVREGNNVHGGAVQLASRVQSAAAPGEILVSDIVRGLARTSAGVQFDDRGEHELKGIAEPQRLFAVRAVPSP